MELNKPFKIDNVRFIVKQMVALYPSVRRYSLSARGHRAIVIQYTMLPPTPNEEGGILLQVNRNSYRMYFQKVVGSEHYELIHERFSDTRDNEFVDGLGLRSLLDSLSTYLITAIQPFIVDGDVLIPARELSTVIEVLRKHMMLASRLVEESMPKVYEVVEANV